MPTGYGQFKVNNKVQRAHRVSWTIHFGDIPDRLLICHKCDNPSCVNPSHLFIGTQFDNMKDAVTKGRLNNKGEKQGCSKLTTEQVLKIRELYATGNYTQRGLGKLYGMCHGQINQIINRKAWTHV